MNTCCTDLDTQAGVNPVGLEEMTHGVEVEVEERKAKKEKQLHKFKALSHILASAAANKTLAHLIKIC